MNNTENWEKEFDEKFSDVEDIDLVPHLYAHGINKENGRNIRTSDKVKSFIRSAISTARKEERERVIAEREKQFAENNIPHLIKLMEKYAEEYGQLHNEDCSCNMEYPDKCECENMKIIKSFAQEWMSKVNEWWVFHATEHRKYCTPEGNKMLTRMMGKKNRNRSSLTALTDKLK